MHKSFTELTVLGFDFGTKKIGIAVGQTITSTATPLTTLKVKNGQPKWEEIRAFIHEYQATALVVGIPYNMDGSEFELTHLARKFAKELKMHFNLTVYEVDERLTTVEAKRHIYSHYSRSRQEEIDSFSAKIILEAWLRQEKR